jgi:hypothetical protein
VTSLLTQGVVGRSPGTEKAKESKCRNVKPQNCRNCMLEPLNRRKAATTLLPLSSRNTVPSPPTNPSPLSSSLLYTQNYYAQASFSLPVSSSIPNHSLPSLQLASQNLPRQFIPVPFASIPHWSIHSLFDHHPPKRLQLTSAAHPKVPARKLFAGPRPPIAVANLCQLPPCILLVQRPGFCRLQRIP